MEPRPSSPLLSNPHDYGHGFSLAQLVVNTPSRSPAITPPPPSQSTANPTRYMLAGMSNDSSGFDLPSLPGGHHPPSFRSSSPGNSTPLIDAKGVSTFISVPYLPSKFFNLRGGMIYSYRARQIAGSVWE